MSLREAITLLRAGQEVDARKVDLDSGKLSSVDALFLHRNGVEVDESQIIYDDADIAYDRI